MNETCKQNCLDAMDYIRCGDYIQARLCLKAAAPRIVNPRAWSKIMLAIRELSRLSPSGQ